jgi:hypothetical protein
MSKIFPIMIAMFLTGAILILNETILNIVFARVCIAIGSLLGKITVHFIELEKLKILADDNRTEVSNAQKIMANLTSSIYKPGETMNLFGNQSETSKTNSTAIILSVLLSSLIFLAYQQPSEIFCKKKLHEDDASSYISSISRSVSKV